MAKEIFVASTEKRSGKSLITIGLLSALQGIVPKVGYMKPIGQRYKHGSFTDEDALLIRGIFNLGDNPRDINPVSMDDARTDRDTMFERIFDSHTKLSPGKDVIVVEGTDYTSSIAALEFDINAELAKNLRAPVLLVANGNERTIEQIVENLSECADSFKAMGCRLLGAVVNRFDAERMPQSIKRLGSILEERGLPFFGTVPTNSLLSGPRLQEVADELNAETVFQGDDLSKVVTGVKILAMTPENALRYLMEQDGYLLIAPGDRVEHILTVMLAQHSLSYPVYSGIILTGGLLPGDSVRKLITGIKDTDLTILSVREDTYTTALKVSGIAGELNPSDLEKVELVNQLVEKHVDFNRIHHDLGSMDTDITTPRMFQYRLVEMARRQKRHIVLPEGTERRILQATERILRKGICTITLLGDRSSILEISKSQGINIGNADIIDPSQVAPERIETYAEALYQARKHKGVTKQMALDLLLDPVYYATVMVYVGDADGFVSGSTHSTADTLGPVLRLIKTREGVSLASSIFFMAMPDRVLVYGDCALVESPTAEQLAEIAITSAETAARFGIDPYVAILSYSTGQSGKGKDVDKVREATEIAHEKRPNIPIEGPIQYDAALSAEVARVKISDSRVAGRASVYVFPDLDAGNTAYKAVQRSANIPAIGPVLQGLKKPANDLSRGATVTDIVYTIAITAIQAQELEKEQE